ncbi:MAG: glycerophosphodiester phosphodiesterase family protein [bacterium]
MGTDSEALTPVVAGRRRVFCCHCATLSGEHQPNSLAAVQECVAAGAPRLEIDVRFLADDSMLIFHDRRFEASSTGLGLVEDATQQSARSAIYKDKAGTSICFLDDVVEAMKCGTTMLQVDLKGMRPISPSRVQLLEDALRPLGNRVIIGSQAHWNLRPFRELPVAFDTTMHWRFEVEQPTVPRTLGVHGLWDDSPLASNTQVPVAEYIEQRIRDLRGILPNAVEWMVDYGTIFKLAELGVSLGERLGADGCALVAWTVHGTEPDLGGMLWRLFTLGVETVITDVPQRLAALTPSVL